MKKHIVIKSFYLVVATCFVLCARGQQQKPSGRSFTAEMKSIQEKRLERNKITGQVRQHTDSTPVSANNGNHQVINIPVSTAGAKTVMGTNTVSATQNNQTSGVPAAQPGKTKPSDGPFKQPLRHPVPRE